MKKALIFATIPAALLILIAGVQIYLVKGFDLTAWKGGGFGMFSTNDGNMYRSLRVFVSASDRSEELLLKGKLAELASRAQMFPADFMLKKLAIEILQDQKRRKLPVETIDIDVWHVDFDKGTLFPRAKIMRTFSYSSSDK